MNANEPFWTESDEPQASPDQPAPVAAEPQQAVAADQNKVMADAIADHEARGAEYYRRQYEMLERQFASVNRYSGIISALERDSSLVDVLEKHIAGEVVTARSVDNGSLFDDDEAVGSTERGAPRDPAQGKSLDQIREEARREGEMKAAAQMELKNFMARLATEGVPAYLQDKFTKFVNNPNGLTVGDMYAAFLSMEQRMAKDAPITTEPKEKGPSGVTVSAVGGSTDRPTTEQNIAQTRSGVRYVTNANEVVPR